MAPPDFCSYKLLTLERRLRSRIPRNVWRLATVLCVLIILPLKTQKFRSLG
jgi:hypothetical protein